MCSVFATIAPYSPYKGSAVFAHRLFPCAGDPADNHTWGRILGSGEKKKYMQSMEKVS